MIYDGQAEKNDYLFDGLLICELAKLLGGDILIMIHASLNDASP